MVFFTIPFLFPYIVHFLLLSQILIIIYEINDIFTPEICKKKLFLLRETSKKSNKTQVSTSKFHLELFFPKIEPIKNRYITRHIFENREFH